MEKVISSGIENHFNKMIFQMTEFSISKKDMRKINELISNFGDDEVEI